MSEYTVGIKLDHHIGGMVLPKKTRLWKSQMVYTIYGTIWPICAESAVKPQPTKQPVHNGTKSDPFGTMQWAKGAQSLIIFAQPLPPPQLLLLLLLLVVLSVFV